MEEILASIRRIIEGGEERPALAQRTRERLAAAADAARAGAGAGREPAAPEGVAEAVTKDDPDVAPPRLFAPANGARRSEPDWNASPSGDADRGIEATDDTRLEATSAGFGAEDTPAMSMTAWETTDDSSDMAMSAGESEFSAHAGIHGAAQEDDTGHSSLAEAYPPQWHEPAERDAGEQASLDEARFDSAQAEALVTEAAEPFGEDAGRIENDRDATFAELPDFSLEFDEESFSAELRDEAGFGAAASERPEPGLAAALAEAADSPAPAFSAPASLIAETSSLMSEEAGAQVAAAFDDLARAIRDGQMKSMEEMTRQMLRPMLQEWLDDNLPRLVEKLVREEIERVSRGGRR